MEIKTESYHVGDVNRAIEEATAKLNGEPDWEVPQTMAELCQYVGQDYRKYITAAEQSGADINDAIKEMVGDAADMEQLMKIGFGIAQLEQHDVKLNLGEDENGHMKTITIRPASIDEPMNNLIDDGMSGFNAYDENGKQVSRDKVLETIAKGIENERQQGLLMPLGKQAVKAAQKGYKAGKDFVTHLMKDAIGQGTAEFGR